MYKYRWVPCCDSSLLSSHSESGFSGVHFEQLKTMWVSDVWQPLNRPSVKTPHGLLPFLCLTGAAWSSRRTASWSRPPNTSPDARTRRAEARVADFLFFLFFFKHITGHYASLMLLLLLCLFATRGPPPIASLLFVPLLLFRCALDPHVNNFTSALVMRVSHLMQILDV